MINTIKIRCLNCKQLSTFDISKKHANLEILFIDRLPCCNLLYDYEPEKPKVTLGEIERRLVAGQVFSLKIKTPFTNETHKLQPNYQSWGHGSNFEIVLRSKLVLDRIEAGAEGWSVEFVEEHNQ